MPITPPLPTLPRGARERGEQNEVKDRCGDVVRHVYASAAVFDRIFARRPPRTPAGADVAREPILRVMGQQMRATAATPSPDMRSSRCAMRMPR